MFGAGERAPPPGNIFRLRPSVPCRKLDFRELKQLQREEMKEATVFYNKISGEREVQDRKFEMEVQVSETTPFPFVFGGMTPPTFTGVGPAL